MLLRGWAKGKAEGIETIDSGAVELILYNGYELLTVVSSFKQKAQEYKTL